MVAIVENEQQQHHSTTTTAHTPISVWYGKVLQVSVAIMYSDAINQLSANDRIACYGDEHLHPRPYRATTAEVQAQLLCQYALKSLSRHPTILSILKYSTIEYTKRCIRDL